MNKSTDRMMRTDRICKKRARLCKQLKLKTQDSKHVFHKWNGISCSCVTCRKAKESGKYRYKNQNKR